MAALTLLFKVVGVLSTLLFIFIIVVIVLTFRKAKKTSTRNLLLTVAMSIFVLSIYGALTKTGLSGAAGSLLLLIGIIIGVAWSRATKVYRDETGQIFARNTTWYLVMWGFLVALTQLTMLVNVRSAIYSLALLTLTTGTAIGMNGMVIVKLKAVTQTASSKPASQMVCDKCGTSIPAGSAFCLHCGSRLSSGRSYAKKRTPRKGEFAFCEGCGAKISTGAKYCMECGAKQGLT